MGFASKSYYEILDIDPAATADEVRKSYTTVKATWDPGAIATYSLYSPAESELIARKIEEAFQILTDPERRRRYDRYRRYVDRPRAGVQTPEDFWAIVEEQAIPADEGLQGITELLTEGSVAEDEITLPPLVSEATRRVTARPEVQREWREMIGPEAAVEPPGHAPAEDAAQAHLASAGRVAAAVEAPLRAPPVQRTFVSPTIENPEAIVGTGWRRPERGRRAAPRPLDERQISGSTLAQLESEHGLSGALLRAVREAKGIELGAVAEHTKIGQTYLKDIEREAFDSLPPAVYLRGFVQQYVKLLRLDCERFVAAYMARYEAARDPASTPV